MLRASLKSKQIITALNSFWSKPVVWKSACDFTSAKLWTALPKLSLFFPANENLGLKEWSFYFPFLKMHLFNWSKLSKFWNIRFGRDLRDHLVQLSYLLEWEKWDSDLKDMVSKLKLESRSLVSRLLSQSKVYDLEGYLMIQRSLNALVEKSRFLKGYVCVGEGNREKCNILGVVICRCQNCCRFSYIVLHTFGSFLEFIQYLWNTFCENVFLQFCLR